MRDADADQSFKLVGIGSRIARAARRIAGRHQRRANTRRDKGPALIPSGPAATVSAKRAKGSAGPAGQTYAAIAAMPFRIVPRCDGGSLPRFAARSSKPGPAFGAA